MAINISISKSAPAPTMVAAQPIAQQASGGVFMPAASAASGVAFPMGVPASPAGIVSNMPPAAAAPSTAVPPVAMMPSDPLNPFTKNYAGTMDVDKLNNIPQGTALFNWTPEMLAAIPTPAGGWASTGNTIAGLGAPGAAPTIYNQPAYGQGVGGLTIAQANPASIGS